MTRLLLKRTLDSSISLVFLLLVVFFAARLTGDPGSLYLPLEASDEAVAEFNRVNGFDRPIWEQFVSFASGVAQGDLGRSLRRDQPALDVVLEAYPATLKLAGMTVVAAFVLATVIGSFAALKPRSPFDRAATALSISLASVPDFWMAIMAILLFAITLNWLPTSGSGTAAHWILPISILMMRPLGSLVQVIRGSMVDTLSSSYIDAARARGVPTARLLFVHGLRNAAIPAVTVLGISASNILNGAVIVETVFGWPGIGRLMITSIMNRDFAVVQAAVIVIALVIFAMNILIDIVYGLIDPRLRT